jgi:hypothetical protein
LRNYFGVGVGIGVEIEKILFDPDSDSDADPDPIHLSEVHNQIAVNPSPTFSHPGNSV